MAFKVDLRCIVIFTFIVSKLETNGQQGASFHVPNKEAQPSAPTSPEILPSDSNFVLDGL